MNYLLNKPFWQLALLSGILMGLATQPLHLGFLAWFGFVPLIHVFLHSTPKDSARNAFIFSLTFHFISVYWIGNNSGASFGVAFVSLIGAVIYLSLFWVVLGYLFSLLTRKRGIILYLFPFFVVSLEWIRSFGPMGFPWLNLALTQSHYLPLIQILEITGTYGVTFWVVAVNGILYTAFTNKGISKNIVGATGIFFISLFIAGSARMDWLNESNKSLSIGVIQPNIDPNEKWDRSLRDRTIATMDSLHQIAINLNPDMILWPEAALPIYLRINAHHKKRIQAIVDQSGIPMLTGIVDRRIIDQDQHYFNGSMFFTPMKKQSYYNKVHLVPFAEYIPLSGHFPKLKSLNFGQGNFRPGTEFTVFYIDSIPFSNMICYESSMPNIARAFVKSGAQLLTIEANDGYLGNTTGPYQHFELARLRAIENRVPIVRSANTGISGLILPNGLVEEKIKLGEQSVFLAQVNIGNGGSIYSKIGDIFAIVCFMFLLLIGFQTWRKYS